MATSPRKQKRSATRGRPKHGARARPAAARAPGRPAADGADQQTRIIDAALACYVRKGIGATSIRDVATGAAVTPALVHYYFGDAGHLMEQVIARRLMPVFGTVRDAVLDASGDGPAALVRGFVDAICNAVQAHPWWPALWVREVVSEGGALRDLLVTRVAPELTQVIARRFALAQDQGRLNPDLDPRLIVVSLIGLTLFPAAGAPIWRRIFEAQDLTMENVRSHALALLERGLEAKT
ncbi:MAG TPA: TetR/AcrR family transcriptional regulator [Steroidobacteraceae bacterium]|nr:TetR/AcrR family transcriptional regulator [Steroidobacteraceae bacterium]